MPSDTPAYAATAGADFYTTGHQKTLLYSRYCTAFPILYCAVLLLGCIGCVLYCVVLYSRYCIVLYCTVTAYKAALQAAASIFEVRERQAGVAFGHFMFCVEHPHVQIRFEHATITRRHTRPPAQPMLITNGGP